MWGATMGGKHRNEALIIRSLRVEANPKHPQVERHFDTVFYAHVPALGLCWH